MVRCGRHLVPKREGLAPLIVYIDIIQLSSSFARVFRISVCLLSNAL